MTGERVDRRQFMRRAGQAVAALGTTSILGSAAACGTGGRPASRTTATGTRQPGPVDWPSLGSSLAGTLVLPADPSYGSDKDLYNERFDAVAPAALAYCQTAADVQRCVTFARAHGVHVAARSGGHSYGGYSTTSGLVIDVSRLDAVAPAPSSATVGAGAQLIDLYATLGNAGRLLPGGSCPTVGIAGLALGGGVGVFARKYGLTCDNIESIRLVTADGTLLTCDPQDHSDLFWACRGGGGGNFGIVTSFTFTVHPIPPVTLFTLEWPWTAAGDVLGSWQQWLPGTPDELWSNCQFLSQGAAGPGFGLITKVTGVYAGTPTACTAALRPLLASVGWTPTDEFVGPETYLRAMFIEAGCEGDTLDQCQLPSRNPQGILTRSAFAAKSSFIDSALPPAGVDKVVAAVAALDRDVPQVGGGLVLDAYGGAIERVGTSDTAFVHRRALACIQESFSWSAGAPSSVVAAGTAWLADTHSALAPYATGSYQNYIDPTLENWQEAYYGSNLPRLKRVKARYDPDDFFTFAQSIPVAG